MIIPMSKQTRVIFENSVGALQHQIDDLEEELAARENPDDTVSKLVRMSVQDLEYSKYCLLGLIKKYDKEIEDGNS